MAQSEFAHRKLGWGALAGYHCAKLKAESKSGFRTEVQASHMYFGVVSLHGIFKTIEQEEISQWERVDREEKMAGDSIVGLQKLEVSQRRKNRRVWQITTGATGENQENECGICLKFTGVQM